MAISAKAIKEALDQEWPRLAEGAVSLADEAIVLGSTITLPSYRKDQVSFAAKNDRFERAGLDALSNPSFYRNNKVLAGTVKSMRWPAWEADVAGTCAICTEQLGAIWRFPMAIRHDAERALVNGDKVARGRVRDYRSDNVAFALIRHAGEELRFCQNCLTDTDRVNGFRSWFQSHNPAWRGTFASDHVDWLGVLNAVARMADMGMSIPGSFDNRPVKAEGQDVIWPITREAKLRGIRADRNDRVLTAAKDAAKSNKE